MRAWLGCAIALVSYAGPAASQPAVITRFDPSVRSAGMGGASAAVIWSDDLNGWANPALLGYTNGLRYRWSDTEILPGPAIDFRFQSDRWSYGWGGLGLALESHTLDYGQVPFAFQPTEDIRPLTVGISLGRALETIAALRDGSAPRFIRYADVAAGFSRKRVRLGRFPAPGLGLVDTEANADDFGLILRGSPLPQNDAGRPALDLTYGFAALNYNDASFPEFGTAPIPHQYRHAGAARLGFPVSPGTGAGLERTFGSWIAAGMDPLLSLVIAADFSRYEGTSPFGGAVDWTDDLFGLELAIFNTLFLRWGHVGVAGIESQSFGAGFGLSLADFAGARYDYARYPQPSGLDALDKHAVAVWFDPAAFLNRQ